MYEDDRPATMSEAHAEWHRNTGIPMGTPGCPQDACHPAEPDWELELSPAELIAEHTGIVEFIECQIAHDDCSERARWLVRSHVGNEWRVCHQAWIQHHAGLGDPYLTLTFERLA